MSIYFKVLYGGIAQLGEHLPCTQGVKSSNLFISTIMTYRHLQSKWNEGQTSRRFKSLICQRADEFG